jgi:hypothetical protein
MNGRNPKRIVAVEKDLPVDDTRIASELRAHNRWKVIAFAHGIADVSLSARIFNSFFLAVLNPVAPALCYSGGVLI